MSDLNSQIEPESLQKIRHGLAHLMAQAVLEIRPDSQLGFGPAIEDGFYYDFQLSSPLAESDFKEIEQRMRRLIREKRAFVREEVSVAEARSRLAHEPFKQEYALELAEKKNLSHLSFYRSGGFVDMCDGPHVANSVDLPLDAFELRSIAGAYWRGNSDFPMMTRLYAWAFESKEALKAAKDRHAQAAERDHRKLGRELQLFSFDEEVGQGLPLWLPNGTVLRDELEKFIKEKEFKGNYKRVSSPPIARESLYRQSGHLEHYAEGMFPPMQLQNGEKRESYYLRPMNCPHHHRIFASQPRSYKELPLRLAEYGQIFRYEESGSLFGLMRARGCCQNDAHIYCAKEQVRGEMLQILRMYQEAYAELGLSDFRLRLSKRGSAVGRYVDDSEQWERSQDLLREILIEAGLPFFEADDEAAFYGPKIDIQFRMASGREETASTIQLDFSSAQRMNLKYIGPDGQAHLPWIIHRAPLGSHERFVAVLIEHFAGAFPYWLAPQQVRILPIAQSHEAYAAELEEKLRERYHRVEVDASGESLSKRVRNAARMKIPYVLVVGDQEVAANGVALRIRGERQPISLPWNEFLSLVENKVRARDLELGEEI